MKSIVNIFVAVLVALSCSISALSATKTFRASSGDWSVASNWSPEGVPGNGDVVIIPTGCSVTATGYVDGNIRSLTVQSGATVNFSNGLTVSNSHGPLVVDGNISVGGIVSCGELTIGETGRLVSTSNVEVENSQGPLVVNGYLETASGIRCAPLTVGASGEVVCGGDLYVNNGSANQGKNGSGDCTIYGNLTVKGNIGCGALLSKPGSSIAVKGNATINNGNNKNTNFPGQLELSGSVDIGGGLTAGDLIVKDASGASIDFGSVNIDYNTSKTEAILKQLKDQGLYHEVIEYKWTGSVSDDWFDAANWSPSNIPTISDKVIINDGVSHSPRIAATDKVALAKMIYIMGNNSLTIDPGASLYSKYIYVDQKDRDGVLVINHRYDAMASFRLYSGRVGVGTIWYVGNDEYKRIRVNKTLLTGVTYYLGSATTEGTFTGFNELNNTSRSDYDDMYTYDVFNEKYTRGSSFGPMTSAGSVYLYWKIGGSTLSERTISQVGSLQNSDNNVIVSLNSYKTGDFGWNLISNPYQFSFPLSDGTQFSREGIESIYFRHYNASSRKYESVVYSFAADVVVPNTISSSELYLAPQQGFFVKGFDDMDFKFLPSNVPSGENTIKGAKLKSSKVVNDVLYLSLTTDLTSKAEDQVALVFRQGGTMGASAKDADKKMESKSNNQLYLLKDDAEYSIAMYPLAADVLDNLLPLGLVAAEGSTSMTLKALNLDVFDKSVDVYLCDLDTKKEYNLRDVESVSFNIAQSGVRIDNRFVVVLRPNENYQPQVPETQVGAATSVDVVSADSGVAINKVDDRVVVVCDEVIPNSVVNVYDIAGRLVSTTTLKSNETIISLGSSNGLYVVSVFSNGQLKCSQIIGK